jgi:hypothetical protein
MMIHHQHHSGGQCSMSKVCALSYNKSCLFHQAIYHPAVREGVSIKQAGRESKSPPVLRTVTFEK